MKTARHYLTAQEAAETLGITRATLYAYASRGQLRSEPVPGRPKERRYYREDLERLLERKEARRDPAKAAARGLHWGGPVLESGITLIHDGRFYYRGADAVTLAKTATLERVAALLWEASDHERERLFTQPSPLPLRRLASVRRLGTDPLSMIQAALPIAGAVDVSSYDLSSSSVRMTGARIIRLVTGVITTHDSLTPTHVALQ